MPLNTPTSPFSLKWNILSIICIVSTLFIYPIDLIMGTEDMNHFYGNIWQIFNQTILIIYVLDILVNFNTSVYTKGILIKKKREIFMYYIKSSFIFDVIVLAPFVCEIMNL